MPITEVTPTNVIIHPLVLLSVVDHYNRVAKNTKKRVVGVLLGQWNPDNTVNVANSYASMYIYIFEGSQYINLFYWFMIHSIFIRELNIWLLI